MSELVAPFPYFGGKSRAADKVWQAFGEVENYDNSGMGSPTWFWTLSTSEWNHTLAPSLSDDGVCSLSDILEGSGTVPQRYFLSARACAGILRRADELKAIMDEYRKKMRDLVKERANA